MKVPANRAERSEVFILKGLLDIGGLIAEEAEGGGHPLQQQGGKPGERERHYHGDGIEDWQGEAKIERHADEQQPGRYGWPWRSAGRPGERWRLPRGSWRSAAETD